MGLWKQNGHLETTRASIAMVPQADTVAHMLPRSGAGITLKQLDAGHGADAVGRAGVGCDPWETGGAFCAIGDDGEAGHAWGRASGGVRRRTSQLPVYHRETSHVMDADIFHQCLGKFFFRLATGWRYGQI